MDSVSSPSNDAVTGTELPRVALTDELTGLYNRRHLNRRLPDELKRAESSKKPLSLFILDVDYFKDINDTHGHLAGDEALSKTADLLRSSVRNTDTVFRYAGDEFAVLLPDTDNQTALGVARKIADRVSSSGLEVVGKPVRVTVSVGVATYPEDGEGPTALFGFADKALYARKRRGRNGVCGRVEVVEDAGILKPASCPELVGRKDELSRLKELLALLFEGKGGLVLLGGEAGVGKTRLLNEFAASARRRGALVLYGRCFGEPTSFPFQPFKDALAKYPEGGDGERREPLENLPDVYRTELLGLIPELTHLGVEKGPAVELPPDQARLRLFDAVRQFLLGIAKQVPVTMVLEDLHSADESSSQLLHYLARNLRESPVLICGAFRSEELEVAKGGKKPLAKAMHSMSRDELFSYITLKRLSLRETSKMIGLILNADKVPEPFCQRIYRETDGNPFFVEEVLKSLVELGKVTAESDLDGVDLDGLEIPAAIRDVVRRRLDMLDPETNRILTFASVVGHSFSFDVLLLVSGLNEGHLLDLIEGALRSQLIVEESEEEYRFSHAKIGETIYESLARRKRRRLHRVVGEALEDVYGEKAEEHASDLSHHFYLAGDWGKCFRHSGQAGRRAKEVYANEEAISSYERALGAFHRLSTEEQKVLLDSTLEVHQQRGDVLELLGRYENAISSYEEMREAAKRVGNTAAEGKALNGIGSVYREKGSYDEALRYCEDALAIRRGVEDGPGVAESLNSIGAAQEGKGFYDEALARYQESLAIRREVGDKGGIADSLSNIGVVHWRKGSYDEALRCLEESLVMREEIGDKSATAKSLNNIGLVHWSKGCYDEALRYHEASLAVEKEIGRKSGIAASLNNIGLVHADRGSHEAALRYYEESLATSREIGDKRGVAHGLNNIGLAHLEKGLYDEASKYWEESLATFREIGDRRGVAVSLGNVGLTHERRGLCDEALTYFEQSLAIYREIGDRGGIAGSLSNIGLLIWRKSPSDEAMRYWEESLAIRREIGDRKGVADSLISKGTVMRQLGLLEDAVDLHEQALSLARETGDRETEGRVLTELGFDMLHAGDFSDSLSRLSEASSLAVQTKNLRAEATAVQGLAETYVTLGQSGKSHEMIEKLLGIAERTNSRTYLVEAYLLKARSLSPEEALPHAGNALRLSEELGFPESLWRAHQVLGRILKDKGDRPAADKHYREAKAIVESIASKLSEPEVRRSYLTKPEHKELFEECERLTH